MDRHRSGRIDGGRGGRSRRGSDRGYVIAFFALLLVPLMFVVALLTDVGAWYLRGRELQDSVDAAALAGVPWMPDLVAATSAANATLRRNGIDPTDPRYIIDIAQGASPTQLQVSVTDTDVTSTFSRLFIDDVDIERSGVAEAAPELPLGSPLNHMGLGELDTTGGVDGFYASINGFCAPAEQGDPHTRFDGNWVEAFPGSGTGGYYSDVVCPTTATAPSGPGPDAGLQSGNTSWEDNPDFISSFPYSFRITVPESHGNVAVYLFDAPYFPDGSGLESQVNDPLITPQVTTSFRIRAADDTPFDVEDNPVLASCASGDAAGTGVATYTTGDASVFDTTLLGSNRFSLFCMIPAGLPAGDYYVDVDTLDSELGSVPSNHFGIIARDTTLGVVCDSRLNALCPQVTALGEMSIYVPPPVTPSPGVLQTARFFLAEISEEYEGETLRIKLFDPGEGAQSLSVLNPDGAAVSMSWTTTRNPAVQTGTSIDVSGRGAALPGRASGSTYNDETITIEITLPSDFDAAYATSDRWWTVQYLADEPTDRTTWSAVVLGDPIRLVD